MQARYLADTTRFGVPWATMNLVEEADITLARGASGTVRVNYKSADGTKGFSPRSQSCLPVAGCVPASEIYVDVLGTNDAGTYFVGNHNSTWQPTRSAASGRSATAASDDLQIIDRPLTTYVQSAPWTRKHEAQLWVSNPFTTTVSLTITQTLPAAVSLVDPGGASRSGDTLIWNTTVLPSAMGVVTFTFGFPAAPGTVGVLPAATLTLVSPLDGQVLSTGSNAASFQAIWPVTVERAIPGYVLPGSATRAIITVTNWLTDSVVTGTLSITVTDSLSTMVYAATKPFSVPALSASGVDFTLPAVLTAGSYVVRGGLSTSGASAEIFADRLQVGLPGPGLDYRVSPMGAVRPNDVLTYTLRFTNTLDVPLSNAVVTASLPVSVTVVPQSITDGGTAGPELVRWTLATIGIGEPITRSFAVRVNPDAAPPGDEPGRLVSEPRLSADEIAVTVGPAVWNLVTVVRAAFAAAPVTGTVPLTVTFTNQSTGDYTSSLWSFGDGISSTLTNPTHVYTTTGTFTVTLTVSGPGGTDPETRESYIIIFPRPSSQVRPPLLTYQITTTFPVIYTAAGGAGGIDHVELWYRWRRSDVPRWSPWTFYGTSTSGSVAFTPPMGPGVYRFYTIAVDAAGNRQAPPATFDAKTRFVPSVPGQSGFFYGTANEDPNKDGQLRGGKVGLWVDWTNRSFQFFRMLNAFAVRTGVGSCMQVTGNPSAPVITINCEDSKLALTNVQIDVGTDTATGTILDKTTGKTYQLEDLPGIETPY